MYKMFNCNADHKYRGNWRSGGDGYESYVYPLQWAMESQIGAIDDSLRPSIRTFRGNFGPNAKQPTYSYYNEPGADTTGPKFWLNVVTLFVGPFFVLALIGVVYHEASFIATERETSMAELMAAQEVTIVPRLLSTLISFTALYLPGTIGCSIMISRVLFTRSPAGYIIILTILAGLAFTTFSHFLGSFFNKANLAGLYSSTLVFALSLITLISTMKYYEPKEMLTGLGLVFPPFLWATLVRPHSLRIMSRQSN